MDNSPWHYQYLLWDLIVRIQPKKLKIFLWENQQKRKANLSLHLINLELHTDVFGKLGKHKIGAGCLYINKREDVDMKILEKIIAEAAK